jgi:hypothetical protein
MEYVIRCRVVASINGQVHQLLLRLWMLSLVVTLNGYIVSSERCPQSPEGDFQCTSGECLKWKFVCDGSCECFDCSDEDFNLCHRPQNNNKSDGDDDVRQSDAEYGLAMRAAIGRQLKQVPAGFMRSSSGESGMSSGALVGIVVSCIFLLLLIIAGLVIFIICRQRHLAMKTTHGRMSQAVADLRALQESGCGLPVDIPVEALQREPPPRYDELPTENGTNSSGRRRRQSTDVRPSLEATAAHISATAAATGDVRSTRSDIIPPGPPPPYPYDISSTVSASVVHGHETVDSSYYETASLSFDVPPPRYQSHVDLSSRSAAAGSRRGGDDEDLQASPRVAPRAGSSSTGRLRSIDSFVEYPSMSDILLTSSRSSLPTSDSAAAVAAARCRPAGGGAGAVAAASRSASSSSHADSAHGDSLVSSSLSARSGGYQHYHHRHELPKERSQSLSDVATAHGGRMQQLAPLALTSVHRLAGGGGVGRDGAQECSSSNVQRRLRRMRATGTASCDGGGVDCRLSTMSNSSSMIIQMPEVDCRRAAAAGGVEDDDETTMVQPRHQPPRYVTTNKQRRRGADGGHGAHGAAGNTAADIEERSGVHQPPHSGRRHRTSTPCGTTTVDLSPMTTVDEETARTGSGIVRLETAANGSVV